MIVPMLARSPMDLPTFFHLDDPVLVHDERCGSSEAVSQPIVHVVSLRSFSRRVVQDREGDAQFLDDLRSAAQVVDTDGQYLCVQFLDFLVTFRQPDELLAAVGSPERPVEHHRQALLSPVGLHRYIRPLRLTAG